MEVRKYNWKGVKVIIKNIDIEIYWIIKEWIYIYKKERIYKRFGFSKKCNSKEVGEIYKRRLQLKKRF